MPVVARSRASRLMTEATPIPERPRALWRPRVPGRRHARPGGVPWLLRAFVVVAGILARVFDVGDALRRARRGPWRATVEERSMTPVLLPGDWLLVDPTTSRWPRRGALVVVREPDSEMLVVKRVAARPGDAMLTPARPGDAVLTPARPGDAVLTPAGPAGGPGDAVLGPAAGGTPLRLGPCEAWLLGDANDASVDSRRHGPLDVERLVGRAWFRYGPRGRIGLLDTRPR